MNIEIDSLDPSEGDYNCELALVPNKGDAIAALVSLHVYKPIGVTELSNPAQYWLMTDCNDIQPCSVVDWHTDENINMLDFNQLALSWLGEKIIISGWQDYREHFSGGKPTENWEYYSGYSGGCIAVVNERLRMDRDPSGIVTLNEAILHPDLTGQSNLVLSFWQSEFGDEQTALPATLAGHRNGDGVAVNPDGINWTTAVNADELDVGMIGQTFTVDLDALGLGYTSDFQIKFQQYHNYPWDSDGREWDDIQITKILQ